LKIGCPNVKLLVVAKRVQCGVGHLMQAGKGERFHFARKHNKIPTIFMMD